MLAEVLAAVLVGVSLFWMVAQPLLVPEAEVAFVEEPPDPEETPRGQALLALKEIEFDRATGKLSDEDYQDLHARYSSRALALLDPAAPTAVAATEPDPVEVLLTRRVAVSGGFCGSCGARRLPGGRFCGNCGAAAA